MAVEVEVSDCWETEETSGARSSIPEKPPNGRIVAQVHSASRCPPPWPGKTSEGSLLRFGDGKNEKCVAITARYARYFACRCGVAGHRLLTPSQPLLGRSTPQA